MGHYDLHGNSYKTAREAMNAELAQCAEIDARLNEQKISKLENMQLSKYEAEQRAEYERDQKIEYLMNEIRYLNDRVEKLEHPKSSKLTKK